MNLRIRKGRKFLCQKVSRFEGITLSEFGEMVDLLVRWWEIMSKAFRTRDSQ
jgi:hypothetical protein